MYKCNNAYCKCNTEHTQIVHGYLLLKNTTYASCGSTCIYTQEVVLLTVKWINFLFPSLFKGNIKLFPAHTLYAQVGKTMKKRFRRLKQEAETFLFNQTEFQHAHCVYFPLKTNKLILNKSTPVSAGGVWVKVNNTNAIRTIFTHKAVGMWAVRDVLGDQGNSDCDCFYPQNWSLNL